MQLLLFLLSMTSVLSAPLHLTVNTNPIVKNDPAFSPRNPSVTTPSATGAVSATATGTSTSHPSATTGASPSTYPTLSPTATSIQLATAPPSSSTTSLPSNGTFLVPPDTTQTQDSAFTPENQLGKMTLLCSVGLFLISYSTLRDMNRKSFDQKVVPMSLGDIV